MVSTILNNNGWSADINDATEVDVIVSDNSISLKSNCHVSGVQITLEHANDTEEVFVGRVRVQELADETWISMWIVADNVYGKGAALNAVQIAETLINSEKF